MLTAVLKTGNRKSLQEGQNGTFPSPSRYFSVSFVPQAMQYFISIAMMFSPV
jgi:hypothetical protein